MEERINLAQEALTLLKQLREDLTPLQVTMVLAAAQELHTVDNAHSTSIQSIIRGDHLEQEQTNR